MVRPPHPGATLPVAVALLVVVLLPAIGCGRVEASPEDAGRGRPSRREEISVKLETAQSIVAAALAEGRKRGFKPLAVVVLDARGALRAVAAEDGTSNKRAEIAMGKANAAMSMGLGTRDIAGRPAHFLAGVAHVVGGMFVPVPGGVLAKDANGEIVGSVGISGDTSDNDEIAAVAGIVSAGLKADTGA